MSSIAERRTRPPKTAPEAKPGRRTQQSNRSSEATRGALIEAATTVFAEQGFEAGSVRTITRIAKANQAAITYHFGGKDGLYRAVLRAAVEAWDTESIVDETSVTELDRDAALRLVIRQFLLPLSRPGHLSRCMRIFGREGIDPTPVYTAFFAEERPRLISLVETLVRRFLPETANQRDVSLTAYWLLQQPISFVRDANRLRQKPYELTFDADQVDWIVDFLAGLAGRGLSDRGGPNP